MSSIPIDPPFLAQLKAATSGKPADEAAVVRTQKGHQVGGKFLPAGEDFLLMSAVTARSIPNADIVSKVLLLPPPLPVAPMTFRDELKVIKMSAQESARGAAPDEQALRLSNGSVHELRGFKGHALRVYRFGGKSCQIREEDVGTENFAHLKDLLGVPSAHIIDLQYLKVTPDLVKSYVFRSTAQVLKNSRTKISYHLNPENEFQQEQAKQAHRKFSEFVTDFWSSAEKKAFHKHKNISGLTAALLVMKSWGDLEGMGAIFRQDPQEVAADLRSEHLGEFVGSHATRYLTHCILGTVKNNTYRQSSLIYLRATTDILVAALRRYDKKDVIHRNRLMADGVLEHLDGVCYRTETVEAHAFKTAAKYAALFAHATSVDSEKLEHRDLIVGALGGATEILSTAGGVVTAPAGVGPLVGQGIKSLGTLAVLPISNHLTKKIAAGKLVNDGVAHFNLNVLDRAAEGRISGLTEDVDLFKSQVFAKRTVTLLEAVVQADGLKVVLSKPQGA